MKKPYYAKLDGHAVVPVDSIYEIGAMYEKRDARKVAFTTVGDVDISTVFLAINHAFHPNDPDLWFETMIFGGSHDEFQERYTTWEEAEAGHAAAVRLVTEGPLPEPEADCCGGVEPHTCPYKEEINDDSETLCTCCDECAHQCRMDI